MAGLAEPENEGARSIILPHPSLLSSPNGRSQMVSSAAGGRYTTILNSPYNATRQLQAHARVVASPFAASFPARKYLDISAPTRFIVDNLPARIFPELVKIQNMETDYQIASLDQSADIALYVMTAMIGVFVTSMLYFRRLLGAVATARINLLAVFLIIPTAVVVRLAEKSLKISA